MGVHEYDMVIRNARIVRPGLAKLEVSDIGIRDGRFAAIAPSLDGLSRETVDADGLLAFPGAVDAHQHWGIYNPLEEDAHSESRAAAQGGVTTGLTYIRTGRYYLNRGGPYSEFMPEVLGRASGVAHIDYGFHVAPMQSSHIEELEDLVDEFGVASFKIFMF